MIFNHITPGSKFIVTNLLGQSSYNKYTTGYFFNVQIPPTTSRPYVHAKVLVTRMGWSGKDRVSIGEIYVSPMVYKELTAQGFYKNTTHVFAKVENKNVLQMTDFEFITWAFANILRLECSEINSAWPKFRNGLMSSVRSICIDFENKTNKMADLVGSIDTRMRIVLRIQQAEAFLAHMVPLEEVAFTKRLVDLHIKALTTNRPKRVYTELLAQKRRLAKGRGLTTKILTETQDVLQKYENSGYWV